MRTTASLKFPSSIMAARKKGLKEKRPFRPRAAPVRFLEPPTTIVNIRSG
jgi:hypothetical protein